jgi:hypothetical protein
MLVVRAETNGEQPDTRERWGCLVVERTTRLIVAHATGRIGEDLVARAAGVTVQRTRRRPRLVVPDTMHLTQTVKHRDAHGRLVAVEVVAALGALAEQPGTEQVERINGSLRDHLNALTRKTHAFT